MNEEIEIILVRYFSGEATEKELSVLDIWLNESEENEKQFQQMSLLYQYVGEKGKMPAVDTDKAFLRFEGYMAESGREKAEGRRQKAEGGREKAEGRRQEAEWEGYFWGARGWRMAAAIAILVIGTFIWFYFTNQPSQIVHLVAVETEQEFTIFENANVTLFPGTEIIYYTQSKNELQLKGKATFNIQSEASAAGLLVQAGETFIKDIGTIFTVDATNPERTITVIVTEGEVWFYTETNSGVYLNVGEGAMYNTQTKQFMMIVDTEHGAAVETRHDTSLPEITFQNTPFHEAIEIIKARYGIDIVINTKELNDVLLNASFDNNEPVEYVLEIIAATISAQLSKKNDTYFITFK
jgi:ferric-dicitrate binding protein FerR (iron transport regulator)